MNMIKANLIRQIEYINIVLNWGIPGSFDTESEIRIYFNNSLNRLEDENKKIANIFAEILNNDDSWYKEKVQDGLLKLSSSIFKNPPNYFELDTPFSFGSYQNRPYCVSSFGTDRRLYPSELIDERIAGLFIESYTHYHLLSTIDEKGNGINYSNVSLSDLKIDFNIICKAIVKSLMDLVS